jgi:hypothetical protein
MSEHQERPGVAGVITHGSDSEISHDCKHKHFMNTCNTRKASALNRNIIWRLLLAQRGVQRRHAMRAENADGHG